MSTSASEVQPLAITCGDPAGIGPDLVLQLGAALPQAPLVLLGDRAVLEARADQLHLDVKLMDWRPGEALPDGVPVWHHPVGCLVTAGRADPATARATLSLLDDGARGCLDGTFSGMVTAPLAKHVICEGADPAFTGHTEYLAALAGVERVVMMLAADTLRVALATTHLPLRAVPDAIRPDSLAATIRILETDLRRRFGLALPRILVLGLNPHAGENGHLGREEIDVIVPVVEALRREGFALTGPVPADTAFTTPMLERHDAVLAMYHDQGLPVLKHAGFGEAVNITLGLPFVRTSVDHGTAFELAGTGRARPDSLIAATRLALILAAQESA